MDVQKSEGRITAVQFETITDIKSTATETGDEESLGTFFEKNEEKRKKKTPKDKSKLL